MSLNTVYGAGYGYNYNYMPYGYGQAAPIVAGETETSHQTQQGPDEHKSTPKSHIVPLSVAAAFINDPVAGKVAEQLKERTRSQVQQAPAFLANMIDADKTLGKAIADKTQKVVPSLVKLGQTTPTLNEVAGIGQKLVSVDEIKQTGGKAWVGQVQENFGKAFRANEHTQGLSAIELFGKPQNWKQIPTVLGHTAHATFTRPVAEALAGTGNIINGGLTALALGSMAYDIGASTVRTNTRARSHEDGSWNSRLETFKETTGTLARKTLKHGLTWTAGSLGFVAGRALGVSLQVLGPAAALPALVAGVIGGSVAAGGTQAALNKLLPDAD